MTTAVPVGSDPTGPATAIELAAHKPGGGTTSSQHLVDNPNHNDCSAVHPTALATVAARPRRQVPCRNFDGARHVPLLVGDRARGGCARNVRL